MKKIFLTLTLLASAAPYAYGEDAPTISDFALQRNIETSEDTPLQSFELPVDVYQTVTSPALNDLRIFNAAGTVVPFEIKDVESTVKSELLTNAVPFFPIGGTRSRESQGNTEVKIAQDDNGKIISVQFGDSRPLPTASNTYLVDLREFHNQIEALSFQWQSSEQMVPLTIETSSNLKNWSHVSSGVLANLNYLGHAVSQNSINCNTGAGRFLRITAPDHIPLTMQEIHARHRKTDTIDPLPITTKIQTKLRLQNKKSFIYDTGGYLPIQSISFAFAEQNILTQLTLSSKATLESPWVNRLNTTVYRLRVNGNELVSGFINLPTIVTDRYWRIETRDKETILSAPPILEFRWLPHSALFLAQGTPPFTLAYGSALMRQIPYKTGNVTSLSKTLSVKPAKAVLGQQREAGGEQSLIPKQAPEPVQWKKWILWAVLTATLVIVIAMAARLIKELKNS